MPSSSDYHLWDLASPVRDLLQQLSTNGPAGQFPDTLTKPTQLPSLQTADATEPTSEPCGLGDFSKLWAALGAPSEASPSTVPSLGTSPNSSLDSSLTDPTHLDLLQSGFPSLHTPQQEVVHDGSLDPGDDADAVIFTPRKERNEYSSDGAISYRHSTQGVKCNDAQIFGDLEDVDEAPEEITKTANLTKTQRKKAARRARKQAQLEALQQKATSLSESENEARTQRATPAEKASTHTREPTPTRHAGRPLHGLLPVSSTAHISSATPIHKPQPILAKHKHAYNETTAKTTRASAVPPASAAIPIPRTPSNIAARWASSNDSSNTETSSTQFTSSFKASRTTYSLFPASISLPPRTPSPSKSKKPVVELDILTGPQREWRLLQKLVQNFEEDMHWLVAPAVLSNHSSDPRGIHVFVDFSNIWLGFIDRLKILKGINKHARVKPEDISFDSLMLLMERRRPTAKRVLVGSLPLLPAFETAKRVGYETNLLHRVKKAKELTERQIYFAQRDGRLPTPSKTYVYSSSSGSETAAAPVYDREKWVEQGVDEILHLKMLESLVDTDEPSTMVLATGDAAEAEYSQGFMAMVLRALKKGWKVELMSWRQNMNGAYRNDDFLRQWGSQFKVIELDDYAADLLDN